MGDNVMEGAMFQPHQVPELSSGLDLEARIVGTTATFNAE